MSGFPIGDLFSLETFDGEGLFVPDGESFFKAYTDFGAPPVEFQTRRGYKQHGATEVGYTLQSRSLTIELYRTPACSREAYWQNRADLLDLIRHNRGGPMTLTIRRADGSKRSLLVRANPGPALNVTADRNNWDIEDSLDFIAFDPVWFDPAEVDETLTATADANLVFPITFPIVFGAEGAQFTANIGYLGTWQSYPIFTVTGPYTSALIENVTTGRQIFLTIPINTGDERTIDLTPGQQSIVDQNGTDKFGELGPASNLVDFYIAPDPEAGGGQQVVKATLFGSTTQSPSGYFSAVYDDGPLAYYRLGELQGTDALDSSGNGRTGTYMNSPTLGVDGAIPADTNRAVRLNGSNQYLSLPSLELLGISFSIECWGKFSGGGGAFQALVAFNSGTLNNDRIRVERSDSDDRLFVIWGSATPTILQSAINTLLTNGYYHTVVTFDFATTTTVAYVNAIQVISGIGGPFTGSAPVVTLGQVANVNWLKADLDEVAFYQGVILSPAQVAAHYAARLVGPSRTTPATFRIRYMTRYFGI